MNNDTPETDALAGEWLACECVPASHARKLERERDEAREICDKQAEMLSLQAKRNAKLSEALSGRTVSCEQCNKAAADIADLNQRLIERTADMLAKVVELETASRAMREAITEVNKILQSIQLNDIFEETMRNHATYALAKLKPFIS